MLGVVIILGLLFAALDIYNICTDSYFIAEELAIDIAAEIAAIAIFCAIIWVVKTIIA